MTKEKKSTINVQGTAINILSPKDNDYISLINMANKFGCYDLIYSWMCNRNTVGFLAFGNKFTNMILKVSNYTRLKKNRIK
jgi:hypothetical protein